MAFTYQRTTRVDPCGSDKDLAVAGAIPVVFLYSSNPLNMFHIVRNQVVQPVVGVITAPFPVVFLYSSNPLNMFHIVRNQVVVLIK
jgi:hypothetical protein